jgi:hypothetical protein
MSARLAAIALALPLLVGASMANAQDIELCFDVADRVAEGQAVSEADKRAAHKACQRALAATASIVQKYQIQEADFDILGTRPKSDE